MCRSSPSKGRNQSSRSDCIYIYILSTTWCRDDVYIEIGPEATKQSSLCSQDCTNREEELRKAGSLNTRHSSNGLSDEPVDDQEVEGEGDQGNQQLKIVCDLHWSRRDNCFVCINFKTR